MQVICRVLRGQVASYCFTSDFVLLHAEVLNLLQQLQVYDCSVVHGTTR